MLETGSCPLVLLFYSNFLFFKQVKIILSSVYVTLQLNSGEGDVSQRIVTSQVLLLEKGVCLPSFVSASHWLECRGGMKPS